MTMALDKQNLGKATKITLRHRGSAGVRVLIDYDGNQVALNPGQIAEDVKVSEAEADRLRDASEDNVGDFEVEGHEAQKPKDEAPKEHRSRHALEELEREELRARRKAPRRSAEPPAKPKSK